MTQTLTRVGMCEVCGKWVPRVTLARMAHDTLQLEGANYLPHSSYIATHWACDGIGAGAISLGVNGNARLKVFEDNTTTVLYGCQTWQGDGTLRTTTPVDASAWTRVCFWGEIGPQEASTPDLIVAAGICASDGTAKEEKAAWAIRGHRRVWFSVLASSVVQPLDDLYFYYEVTPSTDGQWWADEFAVNDLEIPGHFLRTGRAAVSYTKDTALRVTVITCKECREPVFSKDIRRGSGRKETDPPIPTEVWER